MTREDFYAEKKDTETQALKDKHEMELKAKSCTEKRSHFQVVRKNS